MNYKAFRGMKGLEAPSWALPRPPTTTRALLGSPHKPAHHLPTRAGGTAPPLLPPPGLRYTAARQALTPQPCQKTLPRSAQPQAGTHPGRPARGPRPRGNEPRVGPLQPPRPRPRPQPGPPHPQRAAQLQQEAAAAQAPAAGPGRGREGKGREGRGREGAASRRRRAEVGVKVLGDVWRAGGLPSAAYRAAWGL